ncbi:MAG: hypothetical protein N3B01_06305 [Verrucomicrobiae bacterium]|nr:hypothetical protein [Verrucomicrobiae bacterium]
MKRAWEGTRRFPISASNVFWRTVPVLLPPAEHLDEEELRAELQRRDDPKAALDAAGKLAWLLRCKSGHKIDVAMLAVGNARVLHMPGELFVEYQLAAKKMHSDLQVTMAAYGDCGPCYIGTARAYQEGGYETSSRVSYVSPRVEEVLLGTIRQLLDAK